MLRFITDFADQGVILPMVLTLALSLAAERWWRAALGWSVAAGAVLGVMLTVKFAFAACDGTFGAGLHSPSGHTAVAALVAGGIAGVLARGHRQRLLVPIVAGLLAALAIGMTRVALGEHSVDDVIAAAPIGVGGAILAVRLMGSPPDGLRISRALVPAIVVGFAMHGTHLPIETNIRAFATSAAESGSFCKTSLN